MTTRTTSAAAAATEEEEEEEEYHPIVTLYPSTEIFVYKIPKLTSSEGHRAELWDLASPALPCDTTTFMVKRCADDLYLQIYYHNSLFAQCWFNLFQDNNNHNNTNNDTTNTNKYTLAYYVEGVLDSSRYFVLRCSNARKPPEEQQQQQQQQQPQPIREVLLGIGFRERDAALNLKECLADYTASIRREILAEKMHQDVELLQSQKQLVEKDEQSKLSLKEGEKIHVNLKGGKSKRVSSSKKKETNSLGGLVLLKPPPPATAGTIATGSISSTGGDDNDEWGDFESSG